MVHIGDTILSIPFIKIICDNNPNRKFYIYTHIGQSLYSHIKNLFPLGNHLENYTHTKFIHPEAATSADQKIVNLLSHRSDYYFRCYEFSYNNEDFVAINIWCRALTLYEQTKTDIDVDVIELEKGFLRNITDASKEHKLELTIPEMIINKKTLLPNYPVIESNKFLLWYELNKNNFSKICFFHNYFPRSGQNSPNIELLNCKIDHLANEYKNLAFIVCKQFNTNKNNIFFCDLHFDSIETPDCKNLLINLQIAKKCDLVFCVPVGSSWLFLNNSIYEDRNKKIMINNDDRYQKKLNTWYKYSSECEENIIELCDLNHINRYLS
jgi:hypothetical protein